MKKLPEGFDPYIDATRVLDRIRAEYKKYGKLIVAFDYDDTVFDTHDNGWDYSMVIDLLQRVRPYAFIICWSASPESRYREMYEHFAEKGIPCDAINENAPWIADKGRKIYANIYLDDRSGLQTAYWALLTLVKELEEERNHVRQVQRHFRERCHH